MDRFFCLDDFERHALTRLPIGTREFYRNGAGTADVPERNIEAFRDIIIIPRFLLRDVSVRDLTHHFLADQTSVPFAVAPTALHKLAHQDGEIATAKACGQFGTVFVMSSMATTSVEEVAKSAPETIKWLQLYVFKDRTISRKLVERAERVGFKAIVLTVDAPVIGIRLGEGRSSFSLPTHLNVANFESETIINLEASRSNGWRALSNIVFDATMTWDIIHWLRSITKLPILVKGILSPDDAVLALKNGVDGIIVSNHGGRQMDASPATIDALPEIVKVVERRFPIFVDGGIRTGSDVLKALALGAEGVFLGRPILYGLTCGGQEGVLRVFEILKKELDTSLALCGCRNIQEITLELLRKKNNLARL